MNVKIYNDQGISIIHVVKDSDDRGHNQMMRLATCGAWFRWKRYAYEVPRVEGSPVDEPATCLWCVAGRARRGA